VELKLVAGAFRSLHVTLTELHQMSISAIATSSPYLRTEKQLGSASNKAGVNAKHFLVAFAAKSGTRTLSGQCGAGQCSSRLALPSSCIGHVVTASVSVCSPEVSNPPDSRIASNTSVLSCARKAAISRPIASFGTGAAPTTISLMT